MGADELRCKRQPSGILHNGTRLSPILCAMLPVVFPPPHGWSEQRFQKSASPDFRQFPEFSPIASGVPALISARSQSSNDSEETHASHLSPGLMLGKICVLGQEDSQAPK